MPFTATQIQEAGKACLDFYVKNNPIDQVAVERPWLRKLMATKKSFPGAKEYIVEQLRYRYQSNFQWFYGDQQVSYNKRRTLEQTSFPWRSCHDGYSLNEDEMLRNGITLIEGKAAVNSEAERVMLTNLFRENNEVLRLGFEEKFDFELLIDGTQDVDAVAGLDHLVSFTNTTGTVGGISRTNVWWRNYKKDSLTTSAGANYIIDNMEVAMRRCHRNGGMVDFIMAGSAFVDAFRTAAKDEIARYTRLSVQGEVPKMDPGVGRGGMVDTGLHFHGVPIYWNPVFEDVDASGSYTPAWEKRCYFLNCKHLKLRPAQGHDMVVRNPPRVYDRYAYYWGLTWKGGLTTNRLSAHAALSIA